MGLLSKLFDPGKKDRQRAAARADQAQVVGGSATGPGGLRTGFSFDSGGRATQTSDLGSFAPFLAQLQGLGGQQLAGAGAGLPPELQSLFGGVLGDLGTPSFQGTNLAPQQAGLQQLFASQLGTATADPFELGAGVTDKLNQLASRGERDLVNQKFDQLFGSGRLGASVGVAEAFETQDQLSKAGLRRDLAGLEAGRGLRSDALGALFGATSGLQNIGQQLFGEQLSSADMLSRFANQRFQVGAGAQQLRMQQESQRFGQGMAALGGAQNLAQLPLAFQQALLSQQGLKSDVDLGRAGTFTNNAQLAKSPLLEAANTLGSFFEPIKIG